MIQRHALALCESCDGLGETQAEARYMDCPDCLGTGYAYPQKRILNLQSELSEMRYSRDEWSKECEKTMLLLKDALDSCAKTINDYETAVLREHRMQEQRDTLAEALERLEKTAGQSALWDDPVRHNARKALAAVKGGSDE